MKTAIIGGGPAGISAALKISNITGSDVYLFDANHKIGRKLYATGNGRCNITNLNIKTEEYFSKKPEDISGILSRYTPEMIREFLNAEGIPTVETEGGWIYPTSFSAANVVEILTGNLISSGVNVFSRKRIMSIEKQGDSFILSGEDNEPLGNFDRLIIATGSKAFPQLGAHSEVLHEIEKFGHYNQRFTPALAPVTFTDKRVKRLQGNRLDAEITLIKDGIPVKSTVGNIIFTDFGLNGPGVMNLSHLIPEEEAQGYAIMINFLPLETKTTLEKIFYKRIKSNIPYISVFLSVLPDKIVRFFFDIWRIPEDKLCSQIDSRSFRIHTKKMQEFTITISGTKGFNASQAAAGGIALSEVDLYTMESKLTKGLFFAGEVLDVVGPCGGYNLNWAFATGLIAGESAVSEK